MTENTAAHDYDTCLDLECEQCFPEYVPQAGEYVKGAFGNVWLVASTGGRHIELKHAVYGHYATEVKTETGGFKYGRFVKVDAPAA
jgi:hypothetical protein